MGDLHPVPAVPVEGVVPMGLWLFLRAFSGGCSAMTGTEAISNGVPAFKKPESRNAATTLMVMAGILGFLFIGITVLAHVLDDRPQGPATRS